ncbi:MAG: class I SAM-dependent methyltransferase [Candidatus Lokiarchaeota archaeon]|nr:class I SAM-dependent methyltransferase [Candidatus Lokiarchaeota archaeon]
MKDKNHKTMSNFDFNSMSAIFAIRDLFNDPIKKIKKAKIVKGQYVLDYGSGPGAYTIAAARVVGASGKVYAADIHPLSAKKVLKKAKKVGLDNITTITTDCHTGLENNSIDVILCFDMLHFVNDKQKIFSEFHRVLKPNSILSLDCHHMNDIKNQVEGSGLFKLVEQIEKTSNFHKI